MTFPAVRYSTQSSGLLLSNLYARGFQVPGRAWPKIAKKLTLFLGSRRYQKVASAKHIREAFVSQRSQNPIHSSHSPNERVLLKSISHDAGVNVGLFGINEHRLSSLRDFLELDLSQPTSRMLLDFHVYT